MSVSVIKFWLKGTGAGPGVINISLLFTVQLQNFTVSRCSAYNFDFLFDGSKLAEL